MKKQLKISLLMGLLLSFFIEGIIALGITSFYEFHIRNFSFLRFGILLCIAWGSCLLAEHFHVSLTEIMFRYRYPLAFFLLIILVALDVNGSSIDIWKSYLPGEKNSGLLWNAPLQERSDEWATFTPLTFSSFFNHTGAFSYFNTTARGTLTDSFIVYGQPVKDIAIIFRPFQIGYLFLGMSRGLSFYWWSRLIALFLSSLEIGLLVTKKNIRLSVLFSVLITFSPIIHWWTAVNSLVEMLVAGNCFILMVNCWMTHSSIKMRCLFAIVMGICGGCFILALYPAWMVPLGYFFLALFIWLLYEKRKIIQVKWADVIPLFCFLFVFAGGMFYVFSKSSETIAAIFNSAYPGKRESFGGGFGFLLWNYLLAPYLGISCNGLGGVGCEQAGFMELRPVAFLLALYVIFREKKKDILLYILLGITLLLDVYVIWGLPPIIAKITLLSWSTTNRIAPMAGLFQVLMLIRSMALLKKGYGTVIAGMLSAACVALGMYYTVSVQNTFWRVPMIVISCIVTFIIMFCLLQSGKEKFQWMGVWSWGLLSVFSAAMVNPIQKGIDVIYENDLVQEIQRIVASDPKAKWIVDSAAYPVINVPILVGASTINSTNVYPNLELWSSLDEDGSQEEIYNRYAHIRVILTGDEDTTFTLIQPDVFEVNLSLEDAKEIQVEYVLTNRVLEQEEKSDVVDYELIYQLDNYVIYKLLY